MLYIDSLLCVHVVDAWLRERERRKNKKNEKKCHAEFLQKAKVQVGKCYLKKNINKLKYAAAD